MTQQFETTAPLTNVMLCMTALERLMNRRSSLPGMGTFYGPSGYGKSFSAAQAANHHNAYYVECRRLWTCKSLLENIAKEMGLRPANTSPKLLDQIIEQLIRSSRPLIIDEMDVIVEKKMVEVILDIFNGSDAPVLLIGEERMPNKLMAWEKFHGRILEHVAAQPASLQDAQQLTRIYSHGVQISQGLLSQVHSASNASVRRICVNLDKIREFAAVNGLSEVDEAAWQGQQFYTGKGIAARRVSA